MYVDKLEIEAEESSEEHRSKVEKRGNKLSISSLMRMQGEKRTITNVHSQENAVLDSQVNETFEEIRSK